MSSESFEIEHDKLDQAEQSIVRSLGDLFIEDHNPNREQVHVLYVDNDRQHILRVGSGSAVYMISHQNTDARPETFYVAKADGNTKRVIMDSEDAFGGLTDQKDISSSYNALELLDLLARSSGRKPAGTVARFIGTNVLHRR